MVGEDLSKDNRGTKKPGNEAQKWSPQKVSRKDQYLETETSEGSTETPEV